MKCASCKKRLTAFDRQRGLKQHLVCDLQDINACSRCGEPLTKCTTGSIRCRCLAPRIPKALMNNDSDDRPSMQVRYGN